MVLVAKGAEVFIHGSLLTSPSSKLIKVCVYLDQEHIHTYIAEEGTECAKKEEAFRMMLDGLASTIKRKGSLYIYCTYWEIF